MSQDPTTAVQLQGQSDTLSQKKKKQQWAIGRRKFKGEMIVTSDLFRNKCQKGFANGLTVLVWSSEKAFTWTRDVRLGGLRR